MALPNGIVRVLTSVVAIPIIVIATLLGDFYFLTFVLLIGLISYHEFHTMIQIKGSNTNLVIGLIAVAIIITNSYTSLIDLEWILISIPFVLLVIELFRNSGSAIYNVGTTLLGIFYIGLFAGTIELIREFYSGNYLLYNQGGYIIISMLASIWICDSAAYYIGSAFGKHKLFPRVSPNKSWEGSIAGFVFAVIGMAATKVIILDFFNWQHVIIIGVIVGTIGQIGDLVESLIKRDAGVKDSSSIVPGHGGIFDRFDSLFFSAPAVYVYMYYFV